MLTIDAIRDHIERKHRLAQAINRPESGFEPSRRELSEGLARELVVDGEAWTYSGVPGGHTFTSASLPRVFVADDPRRNQGLDGEELAALIPRGPARLIVDTWLIRAVGRGEIEEHPQARGLWRPVG